MINNFNRKRSNSLDLYFFNKFQETVSKAPGFSIPFSFEDFLKSVKAPEGSDENTLVTKDFLPPPVVE